MTESNQHAFQAEVSQVLSLVVNSLYSNKEIFLRELVSNASDALDKLRFKALSNKDLLGDDTELKIRIIPDAENGTLTISDNGIGMTEEELVENLGTIARSGTKEFSEKLKDAAAQTDESTQLIGQFGVGFYSAYLVADRVEVVSRAAGSDQAYRWESEAKDGFVVEPAEREGRGTTLILHLKEDQKDYTGPYRLKDVIQRHSDYVGHPIELEYLETPPPSAEGEEEKKPELKTEVVNQASALWQRAPKDVTSEQYEEFYKHLAHDWEKPLTWKHFKIEGTQMFSGIVFLPETVRADLLDPRGDHGVRLHVRRILAMESCDELLPKWLRFVRGVVDSDDLPLNVSRETLQDSKAVRIIKKQVVSQVLSMIEGLQKERPEDFIKFWGNFGAILKEGFHFEPEHKERLSKIVRYKTTFYPDDSSEPNKGWTSLENYVERMKEGQPGIYFVEGAAREVLEQSPHLEQLRKRDYEVLLMTDGVDPFALEHLQNFDGHRLINAMNDALDLGEDSKDSEEASEDDAATGLTSKFKEVLGDEVGDVRRSKRLAESPACLVTPDGGLPPHMEAMFKAQNLSIPQTKRILEINPDHPVVQNLQKLVESKPDSSEVGEWMHLLHDQALIAEGSQVKDPRGLANRLTSLLTAASASALETN